MKTAKIFQNDARTVSQRFPHKNAVHEKSQELGKKGTERAESTFFTTEFLSSEIRHRGVESLKTEMNRVEA